MIDLAVVGQDPRFGRGVAGLVDPFIEGARDLGRTPELLFLRVFGGDAGVRGVARGLDAANHVLAAQRLGPVVRGARSAWVVSTVAPPGYAAVKSGRRFACWLSTDLETEWTARRDALPLPQRAALAANAPFLRRLERRVLRAATTVYATSEFARGRLEAAGAHRVELLPIPVTPSEPLPDDEWEDALARPTLVFVGAADDPRKNVRLLLDAFARVRERIPEARLRLVGAPPNGPVGEGVEVCGYVTDRDAVLRRAALFVLPSRQEGFGIVAAEALAAGVPVVATPSGGPEALLRASGGGVVLRGFSVQELAETLAEALGDPGRLAAMRAAGRAYVLREHSPALFRQRLATAFDALDS